MALLYCQVEGCALRLNHVCQGEYVVVHGLILTERSGGFFAIVLMIFGWEASLRNKTRWDTALFTGNKNQRRAKKKWRGQCLGKKTKS